MRFTATTATTKEFIDALLIAVTLYRNTTDLSSWDLEDCKSIFPICEHFSLDLLSAIRLDTFDNLRGYYLAARDILTPILVHDRDNLAGLIAWYHTDDSIAMIGGINVVGHTSPSAEMRIFATVRRWLMKIGRATDARRELEGHESDLFKSLMPSDEECFQALPEPLDMGIRRSSFVLAHPIFPLMPWQGSNARRHLDSKPYDMKDVWEVTGHLPIAHLTLNGTLLHILTVGDIWRDDTEADISIIAVLNHPAKAREHTRAIQDANLRFPILVARQENGLWDVLDGLHRLAKVVRHGDRTILAQVVATKHLK